jgi:hypothetical protein
METTRV